MVADTIPLPDPTEVRDVTPATPWSEAGRRDGREGPEDELVEDERDERC